MKLHIGRMEYFRKYESALQNYHDLDHYKIYQMKDIFYSKQYIKNNVIMSFFFLFNEYVEKHLNNGNFVSAVFVLYTDAQAIQQLQMYRCIEMYRC